MNRKTTRMVELRKGRHLAPKDLWIPFESFPVVTQQPEGTECTLSTSVLLTDVCPRSVGRILQGSAVVGNQKMGINMFRLPLMTTYDNL